MRDLNNFCRDELAPAVHLNCIVPESTYMQSVLDVILTDVEYYFTTNLHFPDQV